MVGVWVSEGGSRCGKGTRSQQRKECTRSGRQSMGIATSAGARPSAGECARAPAMTEQANDLSKDNLAQAALVCPWPGAF